MCDDLDNGEFKDLKLADNIFHEDVMTDRYDAFYGYFLKGTNIKKFVAVHPVGIGFIIEGYVKDMLLIRW